MTDQIVAFTYLSIVASVAGLATILVRSPVHSALSLVVVVFHVAGMFVLLGNGFLAAVQVIVYAGAIVVLFLFTMMLLDLRRHETERTVHRRQIWLAIPIAVLLFAEVAWIAISKPEISENLKGAFPPQTIDELGGSAQALATVMFTDYLLPFEVASVLLLAAAIGAMVLARNPDEESLASPPDMIEDAAGTDGSSDQPEGELSETPATHG
ncbi:MAG: NADH-quinone oxidoreductase subunit J [Chloroflexi bacterium]|nr:NADH-quinone oxidoreductase subunit J [Chloroflexota bacterium]MCY3936976.1 NADH-quinone oxidoreductase subunit J [Chloroflexota bacterium]